jgi:hypothetical protein
MNARVVHRVTGYDRETELLAIECAVPAKNISRAKEIAGVGPDDPDATGSYPLDQDQVRRIANLLGSRIDVSKYDYFLEPFAES